MHILSYKSTSESMQSPSKEVQSSFCPSDNLSMHLCTFNDRGSLPLLLLLPCEDFSSWSDSSYQLGAPLMMWETFEARARWLCVGQVHELSVLQNAHRQKYTFAFEYFPSLTLLLYFSRSRYWCNVKKLSCDSSMKELFRKVQVFVFKFIGIRST